MIPVPLRGFGFQVSDFGLQSNFGFRISGFGFRVPVDPRSVAPRPTPRQPRAASFAALCSLTCGSPPTRLRAACAPPPPLPAPGENVCESLSVCV